MGEEGLGEYWPRLCDDDYVDGFGLPERFEDLTEEQAYDDYVDIDINIIHIHINCYHPERFGDLTEEQAYDDNVDVDVGIVNV